MTAIVFDLDGTLIDSAPDIHVALNRTLTEAGLRTVTLPETISFIGHGVPALITQALAFLQADPGLHGALVPRMLAHYAQDSTTLTRPFPGVVATLDLLRAKGHPIGLCTNKPIEATRDVLARMDLARHFDVVIGGDSLPQRKPHPEPLLATFAALDAPALLYVGDSEVDAATAQAAGVDFALFTKGYRKTAPQDLPHRVVFDDFADLPGIVLAL